jgi:hypothetical protein
MRTSILIALLLFCSCYSYFPIAEDEKAVNEPRDDESVLVTLNDDSKIQADSYQHVRIEEPSDFIFGSGQQMKKYTGQEYPFKGKLNRMSLDSTKIFKVDGLNHLKCWLPDSTVISFEDRSYLVVTPEAGTGYLLRGTWSRGGKDSTVLQMIPFSDIKTIEVQKLDGIGTGAFLVIVVLPIAAWITMGISLASW